MFILYIHDVNGNQFKYQNTAYPSPNNYHVVYSMILAVPTMKAFRTATTLCIAEPTFHDVTRHRILLPQGTPVQRELLTGSC